MDTDGQSTTDNSPGTPSEAEISLKREHLQLERDVLQLKRDKFEGAKRKAFLSPLVTTLLAGVVALLGAGAGALAHEWSNRQLEREKFEFNKQIERQQSRANLVLKVVAAIQKRTQDHDVSGLRQSPTGTYSFRIRLRGTS